MKVSLLVTVLVTAFLASLGAAVHAAPAADLLGEAAPPSAATRTVQIGPETRWVNVNSGEVVRFVVGGQSFTWSFDGAPAIETLDLRQVAPAGSLQRPVRAYFLRNPLYDLN